MPIKNNPYGFAVVKDSSNPALDVTQKRNERVRPSAGKQRDAAAAAAVTPASVDKLLGRAGKYGGKKMYSIRTGISEKVAGVVQGGTKTEKQEALAKLVQKRDFLPVLDFVNKFEGQEKKNWTEEAVRIVAKQLATTKGDLARDELKLIGISLLEEGAFSEANQKQDLRGYKDQFKLGFESFEDAFLADAFGHGKY